MLFAAMMDCSTSCKSALVAYADFLYELYKLLTDIFAVEAERYFASSNRNPRGKAIQQTRDFCPLGMTWTMSLLRRVFGLLRVRLSSLACSSRTLQSQLPASQMTATTTTPRSKEERLAYNVSTTRITIWRPRMSLRRSTRSLLHRPQNSSSPIHLRLPSLADDFSVQMRGRRKQRDK